MLHVVTDRQQGCGNIRRVVGTFHMVIRNAWWRVKDGMSGVAKKYVTGKFIAPTPKILIDEADTRS